MKSIETKRLKTECELIKLVTQDLGIQSQNIRTTKIDNSSYYFLTYRGIVLGVVYIWPNKLTFKPAHNNGRAKYREVASC